MGEAVTAARCVAPCRSRPVHPVDAAFADPLATTSVLPWSLIAGSGVFPRCSARDLRHRDNGACTLAMDDIDLSKSEGDRADALSSWPRVGTNLEGASELDENPTGRSDGSNAPDTRRPMRASLAANVADALAVDPSCADRCSEGSRGRGSQPASKLAMRDTSCCGLIDAKLVSGAPTDMTVRSAACSPACS